MIIAPGAPRHILKDTHALVYFLETASNNPEA
jgi:hypothetical protein